VSRLLRALASVLAGNALYFLLLAPRLPEWAWHRPFALDPGLLLDFAVCLAVYVVLGLLVWRGRQSG
jgi:hypothetical protein